MAVKHVAETDADGPPPSVLRDLHVMMTLIRLTEERLGEEFKAGTLPSSPHLCIGQEAVAAGVSAHLSNGDWVSSTHRGHGHYLAKGGDLNAMVAEIYGRATGVCGGFGGTLHVADFSKGIIGANGIVGAGIPLSLGAALAAQLDGKQHVAVCFFGDGAANQGTLTESFNIAALWKLPAIFVCENNGYSEFSPSTTVTAGAIVDRAAPYGIPAIAVDGNDVAAVWSAAGTAVRRARSGDGGTLIEARTYRMRGHVEAEVHFLSEAYRTAEEVAGWQARDPLTACRAMLSKRGLAGDGEIARLETELKARVDAAFAFAQASPFPELDRATAFAFADHEA